MNKSLFLWVQIILRESSHKLIYINRAFKGAKSDISADYIHFDNRKIVITTNKIVISLDLSIVEKYMKELNNVDSNDIMSPRLPQSKLYLKILDILYFIEDTNLLVTLNIIERVIKSIHIFDNIVLASHPYIIKASPKSNIVVV